MSLQPKPSYSFDDWLADERAALDSRHEYVGGEVFAMTGACEAHNVIAVNISREISRQLKGRPCLVYAGDMKVRCQATGTYPDLVALCGERQFQDGHRDVLLNPALICEVLSDSTEAYDRGGKFALYRTLPSLREYLLVSQHRVQAELFTRQPDGRWLLADYQALGDRVPLVSIDCILDLAEVYDKVELA